MCKGQSFKSKYIILFSFHPKQHSKIILNSILASGAEIFRLVFFGYENKVCNLLFRFSDLQIYLGYCSKFLQILFNPSWNWDIKSRLKCVKVRKFQKQIILFSFYPKQPSKIIASGAEIFRLVFFGYENKVCNLLFRFSDIQIYL